MNKIFPKIFLRALPKISMKFVNVIMLTSILLSNITGVVQARAESKDVYWNSETGKCCNCY